jgi:hypothetical protein
MTQDNEVSPVEIQKLLKIQSVRERTTPIFKLALENNLQYFDVDLTRLDPLLDYVINVIKRDFGADLAGIPPHGRWNHLNAGGIKRTEALIAEWRASGVDELEIGRKLIDLIVFSVLIDAGAGNDWSYKELLTGKTFNRSEGLAIVSIDLFKTGELSDDSNDPYKITGEKLVGFTKEQLIRSFQVSEENPLVGVDGRLNLLQNLGTALTSDKDLFGKDGRAGNLIDYLFKNYTKNQKLDLSDLWDVLMKGFTSIWPKGRTTVQGISLGDAWFLDSTESKLGLKTPFERIVTFHKLTQWLTYSLIQPLSEYGYKFDIENSDLLTGLPEYRNGGLFYDFGVITLKPEYKKQGLKLSEEVGSVNPEIPSFKPDDGVIVEWRSITIGFLDYILPIINKKIGFELSLPQLIEAGSWKSGREIAAQLRPATSGPPIDLYSDGTVF